MRVNGKDVDNSNTEQIIIDPSFTAVLVSQGVAELKRGDKITVVFSGSEPGVGLVVKKPAGEPVVPSVIFSGWRID
jgi:2-keto-4-pentenoate hydratase/2-oxohepta-3-ene-1,7-dioic acid hydratase in catechol pathway